MNLFRSEEHARAWSGYKTEAADGLLTFAQILELFSGPLFRERLGGRYISSLPELRKALAADAQRITGGKAFWRR